MKLVPCDLNETLNAKKPYSDIFNTVSEFICSEESCVKVTGWTHKNVYSARSSFARCIKNSGFTNIVATIINHELYLMHRDTAETVEAFNRALDGLKEL